MISSLQQFGKRVVMNRGKILPKILSGMWLCTKSPKVMRFSLRPSAYLCVLCVEIAVKRRARRDTQRAAEKWLPRSPFFVQGLVRWESKGAKTIVAGLTLSAFILLFIFDPRVVAGAPTVDWN